MAGGAIKGSLGPFPEGVFIGREWQRQCTGMLVVVHRV